MKNKIKEEQKQLAQALRQRKLQRKLPNRPKGESLADIQWDIEEKKDTYRLRHIAYCELSGRSRSEIETPTRKFLNSYDEKYIADYKAEWTKQHETVCAA